MDDVLYEKLKENEEKIRRLGPHISGLINAGCNVLLYPLFQVSIQLQLSPHSALNYSGVTFKSKVMSFIYTPHSANSPFKPPKFNNYLSVLIWNSLQSPSSFYKGYFSGISLFYLSILSRSLITSAFYQQLKDLSSAEKVFTGEK